ncbi:hypothetical protein WN51_12682 [Melipona quadrifasciata]|uniref:Uncharacterized protein n=1 Tax=Melipona quadrifasciata TaxID=166423 RepID=A0A0N0BGS7_9HYME|nr:hypothetical protein WN51_12682 [Melipona quadrifasciata]
MAAGKLARLDEELGGGKGGGVIVDFALGTLRLVCARRLVNPNGTLRIKEMTTERGSLTSHCLQTGPLRNDKHEKKEKQNILRVKYRDTYLRYVRNIIYIQ